MPEQKRDYVYYVYPACASCAEWNTDENKGPLGCAFGFVERKASPGEAFEECGMYVYATQNMENK